GGYELDVADVVAAEIDVHKARHLHRGVGVLVVLDTLDEAVGAVAHTDDRDPDLAVVDAIAVASRAVRGVTVLTHVCQILLRRVATANYATRSFSVTRDLGARLPGLSPPSPPV